MPKFNAEIYHGGVLSFIEIKKQIKWLLKHIGSWISVEYKLLGKSKCPKTAKQLGFYWGLLAPEVSKELIDKGWTVDVGRKPHVFQRKWDHGGDDTKLTDTHDWLKKHAARIGGDGEYVTLSEQDFDECIKFISNVKFICEHWLSMNIEALEKRQPVT